jgi:tRNA pseudouridine38-40 synthase
MQVQYIGTAYCGWQKQNNSISVQQLLENALEKITGETIVIHGAGRTDAGVHALDQRALFATTSRIPSEKFAHAINSMLPQDIRVQYTEDCPPEWHPRFTPHKKTYQYVIETARVISPFWQPYAWHRFGVLNTEKLKKTATMILGEHNFLGFSAAGSSIKNFRRCISKSSWRQEETRLIYEIEGNGFLYHMVRLLVGTYMEIALDKRSLSDITAILENPSIYKAEWTAPAQGLCLYKIVYEDSPTILDNPPKIV